MKSKSQIAKGLESVKGMLWKQLKNLDTESLLAAVGLQAVKRGRRGVALPFFAALGAGLTIGAGVGLLLAPMTGKELRVKVVGLLEKLPLWHASDDADDSEAAVKDAAREGERSHGPNGHDKSKRLAEGVAAL